MIVAVISTGCSSTCRWGIYEKESEVLGEDPYTYVLGPTEITSLKALNRYQIEQGLMQVCRSGARAPHAWIKEGCSTLDLFGGASFCSGSATIS